MSERSETNVAVDRVVSFCIELGNYRLSAYDKDSLWLENEIGEGMQVWNNDAAELLHKFFTENF